MFICVLTHAEHMPRLDTHVPAVVNIVCCSLGRGGVQSALRVLYHTVELMHLVMRQPNNKML